MRDHDVFVVSSLDGGRGESPNDKLTRLLLFVDALKRASAARVTAVCPYLCYMRQDRKEGSREPVSTQAVAKMFEAVGVDRVLTMDAHNPGALQNAFRIPIDILEAKKPLADAVQRDIFDFYQPYHDLAVVSPDAGGVKRAVAFQRALTKRMGSPVGFVYANKTRTGPSRVSIHEIVGDVNGKRCILVDDMIGTGKTMTEIDRAIRDSGGETYAIVATHGLFLSREVDHLWPGTRTFVADTADPWRLPDGILNWCVNRIGTSGLFAEAIRRIHSEAGSISDLLVD